MLRDAAALILKICLKKLQKFIRGRALRQKCSATLAPIQFQALLIPHFELLILPKVYKTVGILAKTLLSKKITQRSEFADLREINRTNTWIGASFAKHF